jgi:hypothetical protein
MTRANKYIGCILKKFDEGEVIEDRNILELVKYHPTKRINIDNVEWFKMKNRPPFNKLALFYKYTDSEREDDIAWKKCVRNLYGKYNRDKEYVNDVKAAFRNESHIGSKKQYYIDNTWHNGDRFTGKCDECKLVFQSPRITTDHYPIPYKKIFETFVKQNSIELCEVDVLENEKFELRLKDEAFADIWRTYHDNEAEYRLACTSCNSHFGSYGY